MRSPRPAPSSRAHRGSDGPPADVAGGAAVRRAIEAVWRIESAHILGLLVRWVRDLGAAEDLAQETLLAALERWPHTGIPDKPGAWLTTVARNRALDTLRRRQIRTDKHAQLGAEAPAPTPPDLEAALDDAVGDDLLRLVLIACNPILSTEARTALTLRLLGGLSTAAIARAFLTAEATIAQRLVRARRTLAEARVPFEVPRGPDLEARLPSVLEVIYLIFNEGYSAARGDTERIALGEVALRLGRILVGLVPRVAEAHGLVALMELQASRTRARTGPTGAPVLLLDQDRGRWDHLLIGRGLAALTRAEGLAQPLGPYTLQAAIAAVHARARTAAATDWHQILGLYDALAERTGSPVVALNRAVALSMACGPAEALPGVDALAEHPALRRYHLVPAVQADLLARLERWPEARLAYERAAELAPHPHDQALLRARAAAYPPDFAGADLRAAPARHAVLARPPQRRPVAQEHSMFDHLSLGVADLARAAAFYDAALAALGHVRLAENPRSICYGPEGFTGEAPLAIVQHRETAAAPGSGFHLALRATDRAAVDRFHAAALAHGGHDEGAPGIRRHYHPGYYAAFVRDPDGHRLEAVCHEPVSADGTPTESA